jgi:hypothetical protein
MTDEPTTSRVADLLHGRRRTVLVVGASVLVVAAVATVVAVAASGPDRPVPAGAMPTLGNQFAAPGEPAPSTPARPENLPAYTGAPLWTVPLPGDVEENDLPSIAVTDPGYVLESREQLRGLDKAGTVTWTYAKPAEADYYTVRVTGSTVFVGYNHPTDKRWPQPQVIIALDASSGQERWREEEASMWSATADTIYMSVCHGGQNTRIGDCQLSARDPGTNTIRWRVPTYASSEVINTGGLQTGPTPPYLLVSAYPTGANTYHVSSHDPRTGRLLGDGFEGGDERTGSLTDTPGTVVSVEDDDRNPADGCQATVTGFTVAAAQRWQQPGRTAKIEDGRRCGPLPESLNAGRMAFTTGDGVPGVLNVETGALEWTAPVSEQALAASDTTLLTVSRDGDRSELVAYRIGSEKPLWRAPFFGDPQDADVTMTATTAVVVSGGAVGYDLATGAAWSYPGSVEQATGTWIALCDKASCRGHAIR